MSKKPLDLKKGQMPLGRQGFRRVFGRLPRSPQNSGFLNPKLIQIADSKSHYDRKTSEKLEKLREL